MRFVALEINWPLYWRNPSSPAGPVFFFLQPFSEGDGSFVLFPHQLGPSASWNTLHIPFPENGQFRIFRIRNLFGFKKRAGALRFGPTTCSVFESTTRRCNPGGLCSK